jgi:hypothetical protein
MGVMVDQAGHLKLTTATVDGGIGEPAEEDDESITEVRWRLDGGPGWSGSTSTAGHRERRRRSFLFGTERRALYLGVGRMVQMSLKYSPRDEDWNSCPGAAFSSVVLHEEFDGESSLLSAGFQRGLGTTGA